MSSSLRRVFVTALLSAGLAACASTPSAPPVPADIHIPPFAKRPYAQFSRDAAVQIALREWRAFGQKLVVSAQADDPDSKERDEGLWQRVGDYWWQGLNYGAPDAAWTGKHDANGVEFPRGQDGEFAWSAAFIDYVMRMAGAGAHFPYSPSHSDYINAARERSDLVVTAQPLTRYAPQPGDLICLWRGKNPVRFEDLPAGHFPGHCDIVVAQHPGGLDVVGGNVDNTVAMKRVPIGADGRLVGPTGTVVDADYPWFVALRVAYQR